MSDFRKVGSLSGVHTLAGGSEHDGQIEVIRVQDVERILEHNKRLANDGTRGMSPTKELQRVARIPLVVVEQWLKEGVNIFDPESDEEVTRRLNDPQWEYLRTSPGRV